MQRDGDFRETWLEPRISRRTVFSGLLGSFLASGRKALTATGSATIIEYQLPHPGNPTSITAGPDNAVWFTMPTGSYIGRMSLSGKLTEWYFPLVAPIDIVTGPDGNLWFTQGAGGIARITPQGSKKSWGTPFGGLPYGIARGLDDTIWYTSYREIGGSIGRIRLPDDFTEWSLARGTAPTKITLGPDGNMWFAELLMPSIGRMSTAGEATLFPILRRRVGAYGIARGIDGNLWYTAGKGSEQSVVGKASTQGDLFEYFFTPGNFDSTDIVTGPDGNLWTAAGGTLNSLIRVSYSGALTYFPLPSPSAGPKGLCVGPDGNIWFTGSYGNRIGKLVLATTPVELIRFGAE